jgi:hypothetical protein
MSVPQRWFSRKNTFWNSGIDTRDEPGNETGDRVRKEQERRRHVPQLKV